MSERLFLVLDDPDSWPKQTSKKPLQEIIENILSKVKTVLPSKTQTSGLQSDLVDESVKETLN